MADIVINEISQNYSYVIGDNSYCCVALPITACWGPAYTAPQDNPDAIEDVVWQRFRANSQGLESFVSTYRGAAANYRLSEDYSYQMAVTLLTAGYDVLVCRLCPGSEAHGFLHRSYKGTLADGWLTQAVQTSGKLTLPSTPATLPLLVDADHPLIVNCSNPSFSTATITELILESAISSSTPTGVYALKASADSSELSSIIFYFNPADSSDREKIEEWEKYGISTNAEFTFTGDKTLETTTGDEAGSLTINAKYPGSFGNRLQCSLRRMTSVGVKYWNLVTYIVDTSGVRTAVENLNFVFDIQNSTDSIPFIEEVESQFVTIEAVNLTEESIFEDSIDDRLTIVFVSGSDKGDSTKSKKECLYDAVQLAAKRYNTTIVEKALDYTDSFTSVATDDTITLSHIPVTAITKMRRRQNSSDAWVEMTGETLTTFYQTIDLAQGTIKIVGVPYGAGNSFELEVYYTAKDGLDSSVQYVKALCDKYNHLETVDNTTASTYEYLEWVFTNCIPLYELLEDKLAYNPNRVISPGWDDQNFLRLSGDDAYNINITTPSPVHIALMKTAYFARCATAYIDLPKSLAKKYVSDESQDTTKRGYAQLLARQDFADTDGLFTTHSALFGPWGTYMYVGTNKQSTASPGFLALLIQRSMILNQSLQYEWIQPSSRKNNVNIGKMDYTVSKKYLEIWQPDPDTEGGVGVNAIANIPDLGLSIWGDSTLYENPPATYQALRNLSTRLLVNAIKNVVYKVGISITFQYTNQTAFSSFYVGVTPLLDTMKNSGAIDDYKVIIGNDFDAVGMVKANSCVGKIYITPNGTIQHITVDLIALPPQTDLTNYS